MRSRPVEEWRVKPVSLGEGSTPLTSGSFLIDLRHDFGRDIPDRAGSNVHRQHLAHLGVHWMTRLIGVAASARRPPTGIRSTVGPRHPLRRKAIALVCPIGIEPVRFLTALSTLRVYQFRHGHI